MKKSELQNIVKEEILKLLTEEKEYLYDYKKIISFLNKIKENLINDYTIHVQEDRMSSVILHDIDKAILKVKETYSRWKDSNPIFYVWQAGFEKTPMKLKMNDKRIDINSIYIQSKTNKIAKLNIKMKLEGDAEFATMMSKDKSLD